MNNFNSFIFALRLRECRKKRGLTQKEIAAQFNISETAWRYYESADRRPDILSLVEIADFFGVSVDYLLGRTAKPSIDLKAYKTARNEYNRAIEAAKTPELRQIETRMKELAEALKKRFDTPEMRAAKKKAAEIQEQMAKQAGITPSFMAALASQYSPHLTPKQRSKIQKLLDTPQDAPDAPKE